jgi:hypothetical protein
VYLFLPLLKYTVVVDQIDAHLAMGVYYVAFLKQYADMVDVAFLIIEK